MAPSVRFALVALDTPDPAGLARFYAALTGWPVDEDSDEEWVQLRSGGGTTLAFQRALDHRPPTWPEPTVPQQAHLDFDVMDLDEGEDFVLGLGATKTAEQPGTTWRVYLDPAGHPFCLVLAPEAR